MNIVTWDSAKVRQGADLNVNRSSPMQSGTLQVRWTVSGSVKPAGFAAVNFTSKSFGDDASCFPHLLGGGYDCTASDGIPLVKTPGLPLSPYVKLALKAKFTITPEGAIVNRTFSLGGDAARHRDQPPARRPPGGGHDGRPVRPGRLRRGLPPELLPLEPRRRRDAAAHGPDRPDGPGPRRRRVARDLRRLLRPLDQVQPDLRPHRHEPRHRPRPGCSRTTSPRRSPRSPPSPARPAPRFSSRPMRPAAATSRPTSGSSRTAPRPTAPRPSAPSARPACTTAS